MTNEACENTDREIWRKVPGDYYAPSIHVTAEGNIGINVGGTVIVAPVETWHSAITGQDIGYHLNKQGFFERFLVHLHKPKKDVMQ